MSPADFWHGYTFAEFQVKSFYFFRNKNDEFKDNWERVRQVIHMNAAIHGLDKTAREIMPFTWDKKTRIKKTKPMTRQDVDAILKRYNLSN